MYKYTRQEAADLLGVSTRSIDRYVKSGKIRSKKDGKIVYLNTQDVNNIWGINSNNQEIITEDSYKKTENNTSSSSSQQNFSSELKNKEVKASSTSKWVAVTGTALNKLLDGLYADMKQEIQQKDETILDLSKKLGRAEEQVEKSISLVEYKKSQFMLEESKTHLNNRIDDLKEEKELLTEKLAYEKKSTMILMWAVIFLLAVAVTIWFVSIK